MGTGFKSLNNPLANLIAVIVRVDFFFLVFVFVMYFSSPLSLYLSFILPDCLWPVDHIALGFVSETLQVNLDQVWTVIAHSLRPLARVSRFNFEEEKSNQNSKSEIEYEV